MLQIINLNTFCVTMYARITYTYIFNARTHTHIYKYIYVKTIILHAINHD